MEKITVKQAQKKFLEERKYAKRTYLEGWLFQGFKDNSIKRYNDYWVKLKNSKAKRSQEILNRFLNEVGKLEALQFEKDTINLIVNKINKTQKDNKTQSDKTLYKNEKALEILSNGITGKSDNANILIGFLCELNLIK